jgi:HTH-type transcriptional regulator/antitoxin HigA
LDENDLAGDDLAEILDVDRSVAFKILKGTRNLTTDHLRKLSARFAVSADLFL